MSAHFKATDPDPHSRIDQKRRQRLRQRQKAGKVTQEQLTWAAKYDAKASGDAAPPSSPPIAPSSPEPAPADEHGSPPPAPSSAPMASPGRPMPVPALAPVGAKVAGSPPPRPVGTAPNPPASSGSAATTPDVLGLAVASPEIQAAREASLRAIFGPVARGFADLQGKVETTIGDSWAFDRSFWQDAWLPMTIGLFNRYMPEWMSGPLVEGVAVVMPPVSLVSAARKLEKAGYKLGEKGEPGRGRGLGQGASKAPAAPETPPPKPDAPPPPTPNGTSKDAVVRSARDASDSTANPPAKRDAGPIDVRAAFARDVGGKN